MEYTERCNIMSITLDSLKQNRTPVLCGIYFLFKENELIYIGISKNIHKRVNTHHIKYDYYSHICTDTFDAASTVERLLIRKHRPKHNQAANPDYIERLIKREGKTRQQIAEAFVSAGVYVCNTKN